MEGVSQEQQDLFNLCDIHRLLDADTPTAIMPPKRISILHRESGCVMPARRIKLVFDAELSKDISRLPVKDLNTFVQDAECTVSFSGHRHKKGEVCHCFRRIWVVTGEAQQRVFCYQQADTSTFTILRHAPDSNKDIRCMWPF